jgi:hypothetical protein
VTKSCRPHRLFFRLLLLCHLQMADCNHGRNRFNPNSNLSCPFWCQFHAAFSQLRSYHGQPPALEAVNHSLSLESTSFASGFGNPISGISNDHSPNDATQKSNRRVPPLDLSGLQSLISLQKIQPSRKNKPGEIPWPPRVPCAPRSIAQPSPAGPTPVIGASRGSESERCSKISYVDSALGSARRPKTRNSSAEQDSARPPRKVALVVAQGLQGQNADAMPTMSSRSMCTKENNVINNSVLTAPSTAASVSEYALQKHPNHPQTSHPAPGANRKITSLYVIEVSRLLLLVIIEIMPFAFREFHCPFY